MSLLSLKLHGPLRCSNSSQRDIGVPALPLLGSFRFVVLLAVAKDKSQSTQKRTIHFRHMPYITDLMKVLKFQPSPETPRQTSSNQGSVSAASTASSGSTAVTAGRSARRAPSWNPFRRHSSRDNSSHRGSHTSNVIFR